MLSLTSAVASFTAPMAPAVQQVCGLPSREHTTYPVRAPACRRLPCGGIWLLDLSAAAPAGME